MSIVERVRRHAPWLEPWYDWGKVNIWRLDQVENDFSDEAEGDVWEIELQWFGLHLAVRVGRQPRKKTPEDVTANKRRYARDAQA